MGLKIFDLPPDGMQDGAEAKLDKEQSTSTEVKPQIITEQVSPDDPIKKKVKMPDGATYPEGSDEYAKIVEEYKLEKPGIKAAMRTKLAVHMMKVEIPLNVIDELNDHIDKVNIPANDDYSDGLVGQINQNKKSAQLSFNLFDDGAGSAFKKIIDECSKSYMKQGYNQDVTADTFEAWTVHSYAGDYNPRHSHGVATPAGLSSLMWLKVPDCIKNLKSSVDANTGLNHASGLIDGWTQFTWELNSSQDLFRMKCQSQEAVQPAEGRLLIWPNWLDHEVFPFFGEGERRTFVANFNIFDSIQEKEKYSNVLKEHNKQRKETSSRIKDRIMLAKIDE